MSVQWRDIKLKMRKSGIHHKDIAILIDMSPSSVTNYMNGETEISFSNFLKIIEYVYKDEKEQDRQRFYQDYIKTCQDRSELLTIAEWSAGNGKFSMRRLACKKLLEFKDNERLVELYEILEKRILGNLTTDAFRKKLNNISIKGYFSTESKILLRISQFYSYWDLGDFNSIEKSIDEIEKLNQSKNKFFKDSMSIRLLELRAKIALRMNNPEQARVYTKQLRGKVKSGYELSKNFCLSLEAESYVFEDPIKSILLIQEAIIHFKSLKLKELQRRRYQLEATHDFIVTYHQLKKVCFLTDEAEKAHYYARKGEIVEALEILGSIEEKFGGLSAHQLFYKYLATGNEEDLKKSLEKFALNRDIFYLNIPMIELDKLRQNATKLL